jgi:hypothetical protein
MSWCEDAKHCHAKWWGSILQSSRLPDLGWDPMDASTLVQSARASTRCEKSVHGVPALQTRRTRTYVASQYTYIYICIYLYIYMYIYISIYTYIYVHMKNIHTYVVYNIYYIYICIYICVTHAYNLIHMMMYQATAYACWLADLTSESLSWFIWIQPLVGNHLRFIQSPRKLVNVEPVRDLTWTIVS